MTADGTRMASAARIILACSVVALLTVAGVLRVPSADATRPAPAPARDQTLFGMDVPSLQQLDASESAVGARAAVVGTYADWAHVPDFPGGFADEVNRRGAIVLISWEPWNSWRGGADQPGYALRGITAGDHDALIDRWASEIARYRRPVMLRFAPEMNGDWLPWSTGVNGNRPGDYVAAWRHVRARFARAGATNAIWVWNPVITSAGSTSLRAVFPGAGEVDWVALDGYNWGTARRWGWQSYDDIFAPSVRALRGLAPGVPVMIAETGCDPDRRRAAWVTETFRAARADGVDAVVWFEFDKEVDWRLAGDPASAHAAHAVLQGSGWRQGGDLGAIERVVG